MLAESLVQPEPSYSYVGTELEVFQFAKNWKAYWSSLLTPFVKGHVAEVGAGMGANTPLFKHTPFTEWLCIEPDPTLAQKAARVCTTLDKRYSVHVGTLSSLLPSQYFDTILYIDVLEHIENDKAEFNTAVSHLKRGGHLVILSPAHRWLYSAFDQAIGHLRRYSKKELLCLGSAENQKLSLVRFAYVDCVGMFASLLNRFILKKPTPSQKDIKLWDSGMIPVSKYLDPFLRYHLGKSVLAVWKKN